MGHLLDREKTKSMPGALHQQIDNVRRDIEKTRQELAALKLGVPATPAQMQVLESLVAQLHQQESKRDELQSWITTGEPSCNCSHSCCDSNREPSARAQDWWCGFFFGALAAILVLFLYMIIDAHLNHYVFP